VGAPGRPAALSQDERSTAGRRRSGRAIERAQRAEAVRADVSFDDVLQMVGGIGKNPATPPDQVARILDIALDGLRYRPA